MSEEKRNWREDLRGFRDRMGGLTDEKKAEGKTQRETLRAIQGALQGGPRTVPEIAQATGLPSPTVMWYVMAMKRYGQVAEGAQAGDYMQYALKEAQP
jgi:predicted transcriptional regulator